MQLLLSILSNMKTILLLLLLAITFFTWNFKWEYIFDILAVILHIHLKSSDEFSHSDKRISFEATLEAIALIQYNGYPAENHLVITKDGYVLKLHRVPFGKRNKTSGGIPVYLQHGIMCCSPQWIDNKEESLGFVLANNGYDVWLGNFRGSRYSSHHISLSNKDQEYWRYGWDKHAKYDIPAMIDYIRFVTGHGQILAIAHSMGFTAVASALASQPKLNNKVIGVVGLGPVVHGRYTTSLLKRIHLLAPVFKLTLSKSFFRYSKFWEDIFVRLCPSSSSNTCSHVFQCLTGFNPELFNQTRIPIYVNHCTCGMSVFVMYHWAQSLLEYLPHGYDYGIERNRIEYGQSFPVLYNFSNIRIPVAVLHSVNDAMSSVVDNVLTARAIPHVMDYKLLSGVMSAHTDYVTTKRNEANRIILRWLHRMKNL